MNYDDFLAAQFPAPGAVRGAQNMPPNAAPRFGAPGGPTPYVPPQMAGMGPPPAPPAMMPPAAPPPMAAAPTAPVTPTGITPAFGAGGAPYAMGDQFGDPIYDPYKGAIDRGRSMFAPTPPPPDAGIPGSPNLNPLGPAPAPPGMLPGMGLGMPDPGQDALVREQSFAAKFPRALEAMNRTGLWRGGSESQFTNKTPTPRPVQYRGNAAMGRAA